MFWAITHSQDFDFGLKEGSLQRPIYIPPGTPWNNGYIEFNNRLLKECLNRNHWTTLREAQVVIGGIKDEHNQRHRHSALGYLTPAQLRCPEQSHP